ncbi:MAG: penicillin-binding transpeptidase domain-containing protein [Chloroflexota bacterium]
MSEALPGRRRAPLAFVTAAVLFLLFVFLDSRTTAAHRRQDFGAARGALLDRHGSPLAYTPGTGLPAKRLYTVGSASTLLGFRDPARRWHGLESTFDATLSGLPAQHDWRTFFLNLGGGSVHGGSVKLTIDSRVQQVADKALGGKPGAVVAIRPSTGAVLALASSPTCSPGKLSGNAGYRACSSAPSEPLLNRATQLRVAPGSAFKIVTLSAALDTGTFHLSDIFSGADAFGPSPYFDNSLYPSNVTRSDLTAITLEQALAFSDNFTFAHIGLTLGAATLLKYAHRFGIGKPIPFTLPVQASQIDHGKSSLSPSNLAQASFGAQVDAVTPLQMAQIASAVANHGVLMPPRLVEGLYRHDGSAIATFAAGPGRRIMSAQTAHQVAQAMVFVVDHGSGFKAQIAHVAVAGKTGTAANGTNRAHAWFIAFAPAFHPVVAVAVLREFSGEGFQYAAPIARKVMVAAMRAGG